MKSNILKGILLYIIVTLLYFLGETPRGRMNITIVIAIIFYLCIFIKVLTGFVSDKYCYQTANIQDFPDRIFTKYFNIKSILIASALIHALSFSTYFVSDDFCMLNIASKSFYDMIVHDFTASTVFFRPLVGLSFCLDQRIWGLWAPGYHLFNVIIHLSVVYVLYQLCNKLFHGPAAGLPAFFFALLPIHTESITWIVSRFDLMSTLFSLLTCLLYVLFRRNNSQASYAVSLLCFILAPLCKETAYIVPVLLVCIEIFCFCQKKFLPLLGYFVIAILHLCLRWIVMGRIGGYIDPVTGVPIHTRINTKTIQGLLLRAPEQMLFGLNWAQQGEIIVCSVAALLTVSIFYILSKSKVENWSPSKIGFGFSWLLLSLFPSHFGLTNGPDLMGTRVLYLGSAGLCIVLGDLILALRRPTTIRICTSILLCAFSFGLWHNIGAWQSAGALTSRFISELKSTVPTMPQNAQIHFVGFPNDDRGVYLFREGLPDIVTILYGYSIHRIIHVSDNEENIPQTGKTNVIQIKWVGKPNRLIEISIRQTCIVPTNMEYGH